MRSFSRLKIAIFPIGLGVFMVVLSGLFGGPLVQKAWAVSNNDIGIPTSRKAFFDPNGKGRCIYNPSDPNNPYARAITSWISLPNDSSIEKNPWDAGAATELDMRFNMLGHNCTSNMNPSNTGGRLIDKSTVASRANIVSAKTDKSGVTVSGLDGNSHDLDWSNTQGGTEYFYVKLAWDGEPVFRNFKLQGLNNLAPGMTHSVKITVTTRWVNKYANGKHFCVVPDGKTPTSNLTGSNCATNPTSITVNVRRTANKAWVQGYKVVHGSSSSHPVDSGLNNVGVELFSGPDSPQTQSGNPFNFGNLKPGSYRFRATNLTSLPSGYALLGYTLCKNRTDCHSSSHTAGSSTTSGAIVIPDPIPPENVYYDLWWHFQKTGGGGPGGGPGGGGASCPAPWNNPIRTVSLPNQGAPRSSNSKQHSYTGQTSVSSVKDEWGQNTLYSGGTNNSVRLDYTPHINDYPYDNHTPEIRYKVRYKTDHYTYHGHNHTHYTNHKHYYYTRDSRGRRVRRSYNHVHSSNHIHAHWHYSYTSYHWTRTQTKDGPTLPYCFPRKFTVRSDNPILTDARFNDLEDATSISFSSRITGRFDYTDRTPKGLRRPMRVNNFPLGGNYRLRKWNGGVTNMPAASPLRKTGGDIPGDTSFRGGYSPGNASRSFTDTFGAGVPPVQPGDRPCFSTNTPKSSVAVDPDGKIVGTLAGNQGSSPSEYCGQPLHNKPYLKVYNGSVWAGSAFQDTNGNCTAGPAGQIRAYARFNSGNSFGSSAQYAAAAASAIAGNSTDSGFFSASQRSGNTGYLTFANSGFGGGNWGGSFGGARCLPDFFDANYKSTRFPVGSANTQTVTSSSLNVTSLQDNYQYFKTGDLVVQGGVANVRATIYVDGNVTISGNITYPGTYASYDPDKIPFLTIIARGNIYIPNNVTTVTGLYIAQPTASGARGEIYTCSNGSSPFGSSGLFGDCAGVPTAVAMQASCNGGSSPTPTGLSLNVNGSFIARKVNFLRTNGSIRCASPSRAGYPQPTDPPTSAETFHMIPELYLGYPVFKTRTGQSSNDYGDVMSYTVLPPIL